LCNFTTSPICYGSHCCDAYHNFYCRNFKLNKRIWTSPVWEIELSIVLEKRVEMTLNLILDPAKLSRPCRVESSGHLFHMFDCLANACHVRFIIRFNPVKNRKLVTVFPPRNDHAPIISNQKFFINFKKCFISYGKIGMKNYEIGSFQFICAYSMCHIRYIFFYHDYWKSTILYGPNYMPNIYVVYNKVTYSNAWFL